MRFFLPKFWKGKGNAAQQALPSIKKLLEISQVVAAFTSLP
jgi:hypothetical protein